ncbi:MAG: hypothetical protein ACRCTE_06435 [Cellulosilyticaceae bacterium]
MNLLLVYFVCAVVTFGVGWYYVMHFDSFCEEAFNSFRLKSKEVTDEMGRYYENHIKVYQPIVRIAGIQSAALSGSCFLFLRAGIRTEYFRILMLVAMGLLLVVIAEGWRIWFMTIVKEPLYIETDTTEEAQRQFEALKQRLYKRSTRHYIGIKRILYMQTIVNGLMIVSTILYFFWLA